MLRGLKRDREWRVRRALGAESWSIVRLQALEALLIGFGGALLGLVVAVWGTEFVFRVAPLDRSLFESPSLGPRVLAFAVLATLLASAFVSLFAAASTRSPVGVVRHRGSTRGDALRVAFIGMQVACAAALLTSAAVFWRSLDALEGAALGFEPEARYVARYDAPRRGALASGGHLETALARLERLSGVIAVGGVSVDPMNPDASPLRIRAGELVQGTRVAHVRSVTPGYFYTIGQRLLDGRDVDSSDGPAAAPIVVISESVAAGSFDWPRISPVGRRLHVGDDAGGGWRTVVGVVADIRPAGPRSSAEPTIYLSASQVPMQTASLVAHIDGAGSEVLAEMERTLSRPDDAVAPSSIDPMEAALRDATAAERFAVRLLLTLAGVTLVLAGVGVYGIVGQRVGTRLRELGIRRAVGATAEDLRELVTRRAGRLTALGFVVGAAAGVGFTDFLDSFLFGIPRLDPVSIGAASTALLVTVFSAAWLPARRATRVDTMRVLRDE